MKSKVVLWTSIGLSILVIGLLAGGLIYSRTHPLLFSHPRTVLISGNDLAEKYGLQLTLTATTAMGSWVDVRLKVLDADKAQYILENPDRRAVLRVEDGKHAMIPTPSHRSAHHHVLQTGMIYYLLFPNQHNMIRPGTPVRLVFGDLALEPVITQ